MKRMVLIITATTILSAPLAGVAEKAKQHNGNPSIGAIAHEEVIDGVRATFKVLNMKESMLLHGMEMPKGIKETHHLAVMFRNTKSDRLITDGRVRVKILAPDRTEQIRDLVEMRGHFGSDVELSQKGKYGFMVKFTLEGDPVQEARFWYTVQ